MSDLYENVLLFVKSFGYNSLFVKYFKKTFILFFLPCFALIAIIYIYYNSLTITNLRNTNMTLFQNTYTVCEDIFDSAHHLYRDMLNNEEISFLLISIDNYSHNINERLESAVFSTNYFSDAYLYSESDDYVYSDTSGNYRRLFWDTGWYRKNWKDSVNPTLLNVPGSDDFYICYTLHPSSKHSGMFILRVNSKALSEDIRTMNNIEDASFSVVSTSPEKTRVLCSTGAPIPLPQYSDIEHLTQNTGAHASKAKEIVVDNQSLYVRNIFQNSVFIFAYYPDISIMNNIPYIVPLLFLCLFLVIIIPLLLSLYLSGQYYNSIINIMQFLSPESADTKYSYDELTYISNHISKLFYNNTEFERQLSENLKHLKEAQYQALQMQFNPHFLFNCLNTINFMIVRRLHGENEISTMIIHLSDLLSTALDTDIKFVSIREEISYIEKYIEIEKIRYESSFDVIWNIDPKVMEYYTIKLITQPIIENAFSHGIGGLSDRKGIIKIDIEAKRDNICMTIEDNGNGISPEKLKLIQNQLQLDIAPTGHIGISNVNSRIALTFGKEYGCSIHSSGRGTKIIITLPKIR